jgi:sugar lactone lactonase YvrE
MHSSQCSNHTTLAGHLLHTLRLALAAAGVAAATLAHAQVTAVPPVVFSTSTPLSGSNSQGASNTPNYVGAIGRIASNQRGDVFAAFTDATSPGYDSIVEIPAGTHTQVTLVAHVDYSGGQSKGVPMGVTLDPYGNLWFLTIAPDGYDSSVAIIPFVNGTYASGIDLNTTILPTCSLPAITTSVPCQYPNIVASNFYGYLQLSDLAVDASGNLFVVDWADSASGYDSYMRIVEYNATTGVDTIAVDNITPPGPCCNGDTNGRLALDASGNFYYVDGVHFFYSAAGSGTYSSISGFSMPTGVSSDSSGNIYVADTGNDRIAVLPNLGGTVMPADAYTIVSGAPLGIPPTYSPGIDGYGTITYPGQSDGDGIQRAVVGTFNFGSAAIGATTSATTINLLFTAAQTMGNLTVTGPFAVATNGCPATTTYTAGQFCSVTVTYTPTGAGPQTGTVHAYSAGGALLGTAPLSGSGTASLIDIDPGTVSSIGSGWKAPSAIAVDSLGNNFVADATTGDIYENGNSVAIATGFSSPSGVVVDGTGNLYVADSGNERIMEVPFTGTAYGAPAAVYTGLKGQTGLAIDAAGNLYVADSGNGRVLLLAGGGGLPVGSNVSYVGASVSSTGTLMTNFTNPVGVAADSLGNVYVADGGNIIQVSVKNGATTTVAQGIGTAAAVAVDPGGNVYYADSATKTVTRLPNLNGSVTGSGATVIMPSVVAIPTGIALDAGGNLYAVDTSDATVGMLTRTSGALSFGNVVDNVSSSPMTATVFNSGTAAASLASPYAVASGTDSSDFAIQGSSTCANAATIATGTSCDVVEVFQPTKIGAESSTLTFPNNAATISLTGTGVVLVTATITGPSSLVYGAPGTFTASVTPNVAPSYPVNFTNAQGVTYSTTVTIGTNGTGTFSSPAGLPVGSYTVSLVGTVSSTPTTVTVTQATLVASVSSFTRQYGQQNPAFPCKFTSGIVNGDAISCVGSVASNVNTVSAPGVYPITPTIVGPAAANYSIAPPPISTSGMLTITKATLNVVLKITAPQSSIGTILVGSPVTFLSTVAQLSAGGVAPTGTVTFENVTLTNSIVDIGTTQTLSATDTASVISSTLSTGTIYVEAVYSGDVNYAANTSIATQLTISPFSFTMSINPQTLVIPQGQFGTAALTLTQVGNFVAPITLSCSGLPLETSCAFSPATTTLSSSAPQSVALVITTTAATSTTTGRIHRALPWKEMGGGTVLALMVGTFAGFRRKRFSRGLFTFLLVALLGLLPLNGCGGLDEKQFVTPLGTYPSVTITAASNSTGVVVPVTLRLSVTSPN